MDAQRCSGCGIRAAAARSAATAGDGMPRDLRGSWTAVVDQSRPCLPSARSADTIITARHCMHAVVVQVHRGACVAQGGHGTSRVREWGGCSPHSRTLEVPRRGGGWLGGAAAPTGGGGTLRRASCSARQGEHRPPSAHVCRHPAPPQRWCHLARPGAEHTGPADGAPPCTHAQQGRRANAQAGRTRRRGHGTGIMGRRTRARGGWQAAAGCVQYVGVCLAGDRAGERVWWWWQVGGRRRQGQQRGGVIPTLPVWMRWGQAGRRRTAAAGLACSGFSRALRQRCSAVLPAAVS